MPDDVPPVAESVLQKARLILGAFDAPSPQLGLSELSRRTGLAKTTVHRVATELVSVGLLARYGRRYELAPLLFGFGQRVPRARALRLAASPYLEDLAITTRETVVLGVPGDHDVLFVEKFFGYRGGGTTVTKVEGRVPFHCSASGKVLLAFGDPEMLERVTAKPLRPRTAKTITDPQRLRAEVARVREDGYAVERQEVVLGYGAVGAPVLVNARAVATITVVTPIDRLDVRSLAPATGTAARALSRVVDGDGRSLSWPWACSHAGCWPPYGRFAAACLEPGDRRRRCRDDGERPMPTRDDVLGYFDTLSNWGRWGDEDELGTLNHITDEVRLAAAGAVRHGRSVSCAWEVGVPAEMQRSTTVCPCAADMCGNVAIQERQLFRDVDGFPDVSVRRVLGSARRRLRRCITQATQVGEGGGLSGMLSRQAVLSSAAAASGASDRLRDGLADQAAQQ